MLKIKDILKGEDETLFNRTCASDPAFFIERVLGPNIHPKFHIGKFHKEMIDLLINSRYANLTAFRGSLKTSIGSIGLPIWCMKYMPTNYKLMGLTCSSYQYQAKPILADVQMHLKDNEFLKHLVPTDSKYTWNKDELNTTNGCKYKILPYNDSARSSSLDLLVVDDVLRSKDISQSEIIRIFWQVFYKVADKRDGQIWVVCTPQTYNDLLAKLRRKKQFNSMLIPVGVMKNNDIVESTWVERYTLKKLKNERDLMGEINFMKEMMCTPFAAQDQIFSPELLEKVTEKGFYGLDKCRPEKFYFLGVDIAYSKSSTADYSAFSIMEKGDKDGKIHQVYVKRYKGWSPSKIIEEIKRLHQLFNFNKILVEDRGVSVGMVADMIDPKLHPEIAHFVEGFKTNQQNKEMLIGRFLSAVINKTTVLVDNVILSRELQSFNMIEKEDTLGNKKTTYEGVGEHDDVAIATFISFEASTRAGVVPTIKAIVHE